MSKHFDKLFKTLKTRQDVTALGFSKDELKSLASDIDGNLDSLEETATDEDVENKIKDVIDGVIPMLKLAQMQASRTVAKKLKEAEDARLAAEEEEKRKKEDEESAKQTAATEQKPKQEEPPVSESRKDDDELKSLIKALNEKMTKQEEALAKQNETIANLMRGNIKEKRKAIVDAKLKNAGTLGRTYLRMFERLDIKDDNEFNEFLEQIDEDLKDYKQDVANELLAKQSPTPPVTPSKKDEEEEKVDVMSDEEIDSLVDDD